MTVQYREMLGGETRAIGDESAREIEAKVCSYGVGPDTYNTTWSGPGCFTRGLQESLPAVCWSHQPDNVIGSVTSYRDESDGLYVRMKLADFDAVPEARKAYSLIKDGHIRGWSFGFADGVTEPDSQYKGALAFRSAQIYEISPVLRASVPLTRTVAVRSVDGEVEARDENELAAALTAGIRAALDGGKATTITIGDDGGVTIGERSEPEPVAVAAEAPRTLTVSAGDGDPVEVSVPEGDRSVTLVINDDGTVSAAGYSMDGAQADGDNTGDAADPDADAGQLASAIDAALDAYAGLMDGVDTTELPAQVQQALALADAAGVAADELLDAMGLPDPDEDGDRAAAKGDPVTVGKKSGKVKRVMPNGALLVDWGDGKSSIVSAADAEEPAGASERAAKGHAPEHLGFKKLKGMLAAKGAADPGALAAWIGRKKYGDAGMAAKSAAGRVSHKRSVGLSDEQALAELERIGLSVDDASVVEALAADKAVFEAAQIEPVDGGEGAGDDVEAAVDASADRSDEPDIEMTRAALDLLATR